MSSNSQRAVIAYGVGSALQLTDIIFELTGNDSLPPISNHIGDFGYPYALGLGTCLFGFFMDRRFNTNSGYYLSQAAPLLLAGYISLGESVCPNILRGTADVWDIPAAVLGGVIGFFTARYLGKWMRESEDLNSNKKP